MPESGETLVLSAIAVLDIGMEIDAIQAFRGGTSLSYSGRVGEDLAETRVSDRGERDDPRLSRRTESRTSTEMEPRSASGPSRSLSAHAEVASYAPVGETAGSRPRRCQGTSLGPSA